jgi:UDP-N-acetylglucosamine--N-acetylmuramyl-(pentapeptide) pyrophosphoryl-undecaprenol N-acetylglucosamine transferase
MNESQTVLVMAGGTGGHVFPALAVAARLQEWGWRVEWLGTESGMEARVVPANGIPLNCISVVGLRGKSWRKLLVAPWFLLKAVLETWSVFRRVSPDVVLGMGGFVSGPGGVCAALRRVPLVIHEQNAVAGTANRLLARLANNVLSAFPGVLPACVQVGNPVRKEIAMLAGSVREPYAATRRLRVLVLGGSQGARALNALVPQALALLPELTRPEVLHQSGKLLHEETVSGYNQSGVDARIEPFVENMASLYQWADLAICRAGAMTVSELACAGLPALLVPLPGAIDDHQTYNARWLVDAGGARLLPQAGLTAEILASEIQACIENPDVLIKRVVGLQKLAAPEAAKAVADACVQASLFKETRRVQE